MLSHPYPDKTYKDKVKRVVKGWSWFATMVLGLSITWAMLGAPQSYSGEQSDLRKCIRFSNAVIWDKNPEADISHYEIYAARRESELSGDKLSQAILVGSVTVEQITIPKNLRNKVYFFTVRAVDTSGNKSEPAEPYSCFQAIQ